MRQYADIVAFDKNGQLTLIAEVKNKWGTSNDWATKMRRNMFSHGLMPHAPFFLLALPDVFYLWNGAISTPDLIEPNLKVDPRPFLQSHYATSDNTIENLTGRSFELVVTSWLNQVLNTSNPQYLTDNHQEWLISSGLFGKIVGGHLELEAAA